MQAYASLIEHLAPRIKLFGIRKHPSNFFLPASLEMPSLRFFCLRYPKSCYEFPTSLGQFVQNICRNSPHLEVLVVESRGYDVSQDVGDIDFSELPQK